MFLRKWVGGSPYLWPRLASLSVLTIPSAGLQVGIVDVSPKSEVSSVVPDSRPVGLNLPIGKHRYYIMIATAKLHL